MPNPPSPPPRSGPVPPEVTVPSPDGSGGTEAIRTLLGSRPETVPRYELGDRLGRGGMGEVHAAHDVRLRRTIALKSLRAAAPSEDVVARFLREAQVTGQLEHPNVVPVYDIGLDPFGGVFYTMKKVQGRSLAQFVKDGKGGRVARLRIFLQICEAVAYAHNRSVVHRDLKPANVMLGEFGEVLVLDWGLAKSVGEPAERPVHSGAGGESLSDLTRADVVMGTPSWMSPEQASKAPAHPAADQYALGAILYLLLTGRPPFKPGAEVLDQVREGRFARPRAVEPNIPRPLEAVVLRAMALEPAARYASVAALRDDILNFLEDRPVAALQYTLRDRAARWGGRHWRSLLVASAIIAGFAAVSVAAVALAAGIWSWGVTAARDMAVDSEREVTRHLAETQVALALVDVEAGRSGAASAKLDAARAAWAGLGEADPPLLARARGYLAWRDDPPPIAWTSAGFSVADVSADGRSVVAAEEGGRFVWLDAVTGATRAEAWPEGWIEATGASFTGPRPVVGWTAREGAGRVERWATLEPDGRLSGVTTLPTTPVWLDGDRVVLSRDGSRALLARDRVQVVTLPGGHPTGVALDGLWVTGASADLSRVVGRLKSSGSYLRAAVDVGVWDTRTGESIWYQRTPAVAELSGDGSLLALVQGDPATLSLIDLKTGAVRWEEQEDFLGAPSFLPGGTQVVVFGWSRVRSHLVVDGSVVSALSVHSPLGSGFSSSGDHLLTARRGRLEMRPWRPERPARALVELPRGSGLRAVDLSADGQLLAFATFDGRAQVLDSRGGRPLRVLASNPCVHDEASCGTRDVAFDDTGSQLAVADRDGKIRVWDLATSRVRWAGDAGLGIVAAVDWLGDRLVSAHENGAVVEWDPASGTERARFHQGATAGWDVVLHPDGRRLLLTGRGSDDPQVEVWDLVDRLRIAVADRTGSAYRGSLSPDGTRFAVGTAGEGVFVWDLTAVPLSGRQLFPGDEGILSVAWTPDGAELLVGWLSGRVSVVDVARGAELLSLPLHEISRPGSVQDIAISSDGRMFTVGDDGRLVDFDLGSGSVRRWEVPLGASASGADLLEGARQAVGWWDWDRALALYDAAAAAGERVTAIERGRVLRELGRREEIDREAVLAEGMSAGTWTVWSTGASTPPAE